jgi:hypothetical protein
VGTAVAATDVVASAGLEVAVAEDPQANSRTTNNKRIALGRLFLIRFVGFDIGTAISPCVDGLRWIIKES